MIAKTNLNAFLCRWRRILGMCSAAKLVPIRVPALDGNRLYEPPGEIQTSLLLNSTKFCCDSDSFVQSIDDTLAVCIGCSVEYHFISDSSVTRSWDSTLNATFDSSCLPNTATPLTNGERACAASHLKIWNLIRVIASTDKDQAISEKLDQCSILIDHQNRRQCLGHSVCGSSYFNWLKLFFRLKSFGSVNNSDNKYFLIFEDDAQINSLEIVQFKETVVALMAELPEEADILYLGHSTPSTAKKAIFRGGKYVKVNYLWQLHAYAIRYKAIEKLLKHLPIDQPVDNFIAKLAHEEKLNVSKLSSYITIRFKGDHEVMLYS